MKILLIRLRLIGDVVFTTPAIRAIRELHPHAHLSYLVEPLALPVVAHHPALDAVIVAPHVRGLARLASDAALAWSLRQQRFETVLDFHGGPRSAWLAWATGARERIGYDVAGRSWMYTTVVPRARELRPRHSVANQWDLVAALGGTRAPTLDSARYPTVMADDPGAVAHVARWLRERRLDALRLVVVHVSAGNAFRRWPAPAFIDLVASLAVDPARGIVLTAGPSDAAAAETIRKGAVERLGAPGAGRIAAADDLDLAGLRALIARAALFVGGDSGPLHVASTTETPIVGLYGPTLVERSGPWRSPHLVSEAVDAGALPCRPCHQRRCEPGDFRCLTTISAQQVVDAAERALNRGQAARQPPVEQLA